MMKRLIVATVVAMALACGSSTPVGPGNLPLKPVLTLRVTAGSLSSSSITVAPGSVTPLKLTATYSDFSLEEVSSRATWTASNPDVVRIDGTQVVAIQAGESGITGVFGGMTARLMVTVLETGTVIVQGSVLDSGFALQGARVEVLSGIGAGKAATTDANGRYKLFGLLGSIQMRASLDGYVSQTVDATASASKSVNFALTPTTPPIDLGGNWDLTFDASPSCTTLPDVARQRTYTAAITQTGTSLRVTLSGANFAPDTSFYYAPGSLENQFRAHVVGNAIALTLNTFNYYGTHYDLAEIIADNTQLRIVGKGSGTITSSTVSGTLDGYLAVFTSGSPPSGVTCTAADHRFTFVRHSATSGRRR